MDNLKKKPVIFVQGDREFYRSNEYAQNLLLKAISKGITDPKDLMKISGIKTVAGVFRTLDKMAIRKEYHAALGAAGIDLNYIVGGIKQICDGTEDDKIRLDAFKVLMKSIGLEKYDIAEESAKGWEEAILDAEKNKVSVSTPIIDADYEVVIPQIPEKAKALRDIEIKNADELYGRSVKGEPEKT